jgi:hypothetical protein
MQQDDGFSVYVRDPDGNKIELYGKRRASWPHHFPSGNQKRFWDGLAKRRKGLKSSNETATEKITRGGHSPSQGQCQFGRKRRASHYPGETHAQSERDITSTVAACATNRGIAANGLTQRNACAVRWQ